MFERRDHVSFLCRHAPDPYLRDRRVLELRRIAQAWLCGVPMLAIAQVGVRVDLQDRQPGVTRGGGARRAAE